REKAHFLLRIGVGMLTADDEASKATMRSAQGKRAGGLNPKFLQLLHHPGEARLGIHQGNDQGLLMLIHPAGHRLFRRKVWWQTNARLAASLEQMPVDLVRRFVVLGDTDAFKLDDMVQFARDQTEEFLGISRRGEDLRDAEQCLITRCELRL